MTGSVKCYFSFRSPYAFLALHRLGKILQELPVIFEFTHTFPSSGKQLSVEQSPAKLAYIRRDVSRIASAYGYTISFPKPFDINWIIPHAAFLYAREQGKAHGMIMAMYRSRFVDGANLENAGVLSSVAQQCDLRPEDLVGASQSEEYHQRVMSELETIPRKKVFGVPTFLYGDNRYWGNDRIEWLIRDIYINSGMDVPDLVNDPMARPY